MGPTTRHDLQELNRLHRLHQGLRKDHESRTCLPMLLHFPLPIFVPSEVVDTSEIAVAGRIDDVLQARNHVSAQVNQSYDSLGLRAPP